MKLPVFLSLLLIFSLPSLAQRSAEVLEADSSSLQERFDKLKSTSETFKDYKVIRAYVLDGMWKIAMDSAHAQKILLREANASIVKLQGKLDSANASMAEKEAAMAETLHDSTHINVIGIDMAKSTFLSVIGIVLLALLVVIGILFTRMRWVHNVIKEKTEKAESLSNEFEEYKRKALEKQMKLSRELQTERNKLQELGSA